MNYTILTVVIFILGYIGIALEHTIKLNKAASALIMGVLCWLMYFMKSTDTPHANELLLQHLGEIASIVFFLLGAMTIVALIDTHNGFDLITRKITTTRKSRLLIIVTIITFFLSSLLDNLTTAIVMTSLCIKLLNEREDRFWFAGMIIIAANAGGAWSPLGDVSTTMLWIGGQITALNIIGKLILPSMSVCFIPAILVARRFKNQRFKKIETNPCTAEEQRVGRIVLFCGIGLLVFVPVFKTLTHLPPFMGMLLALGIMWLVTTLLYKDQPLEDLEQFTVTRALQTIDTPSILFFLGILMAVAAIQSMGLLTGLATVLSNALHNDYAIGVVLGLLSAVVDNVPLVAASQGMYDLNTYPTDHNFWEFLALTTGTGGSAVIIGSAAGVAVMGLEQINFMMYLRKIAWLALLGFAAGIAVFMLQVYVSS